MIESSGCCFVDFGLKKKGRDRVQKGQSIVTSTRLTHSPCLVPNGPTHPQMGCGVLQLYFCRRGHVIQKKKPRKRNGEKGLSGVRTSFLLSTQHSFYRFIFPPDTSQTKKRETSLRRRISCAESFAFLTKCNQ